MKDIYLDSQVTIGLLSNVTASMVLFAFVFVLTLINLRLLRRGGLE